MTTIIDLIENINNIDVESISVRSIKTTQEHILDLNREQLKSGFDSDGKRLKRYRNKSYAQMKNAMNPEPGMWHPDLILTGAFVSSFDIKVDNGGFIITANDQNNLLEKYGDNVLGLVDTQQEYYNQDIFFPEFRKEIENETGL